jgi:signal transduction histidine kinase
VRADSTTLRASVDDDGRGVDPNVTPGVGLRSMEQRATELGGTLQIGPRPGGGTRVALSLPVSVATEALDA